MLSHFQRRCTCAGATWPDPGPSMAGRIPFAVAAISLDHHIDPGAPQGLGVPNGPGEQNDAVKPTAPSTTAPRL